MKTAAEMMLMRVVRLNKSLRNRNNELKDAINLTGTILILCELINYNFYIQVAL